MKLKFPSIRLPRLRRKKKTADELKLGIASKGERKTARISAKAERKAAKIIAKGESRVMIEKAKTEHHSESLMVKTVKYSTYVLYVAGIFIIGAGYWIDILFYMQQSDVWYVMVALFVFAIVARSIAALGDILLHWTKPGNDGDEDNLFGMKDLARDRIDTKGERHVLRFMWIASIIICFVATASFFSTGHESRQASVAAIENTGDTIVSSKKARIDALEAQKAEAREARDTAIAAADKTIEGIKDETPGVSVADNATIQKAEDSKLEASRTYTAALADLNGKINAIESEREVELRKVADAENSSGAHMAVYKFFSRFFGSADLWSLVGALFFAAMFELFCAKLLAIASAFTKFTRALARSMALKEADTAMNTRLTLDRMKSNIEINGLRLAAAHKQEQADAEIELALRQRQAEKAAAQAEALRKGEPWVDPDILVNEMANLKRAEIDREIAEMRAQAERLRSGDPDPNAPMSPQEKGRKGAEARDHYQQAQNETLIEIPPMLSIDEVAEAAE